MDAPHYPSDCKEHHREVSGGQVRKIIFVCAVILAALSIPQVAGASPQMVQHWGSFTGVASQNSSHTNGMPSASA